MKFSVIIPMFNESSILLHTIKTLTDWLEGYCAETGYCWELIFSDDGSSDNCGQMVLSYASDNMFSCGTLHLVSSPINRGKGHAVGLGVANATGDILLYTDCDLAYGTDVIAQLIDVFKESSCDVCIGSRNLTEDGYAGYTPIRKLASKTYIKVLCLVAGFRLSDSQCGFKAFKGEIARKVFSIATINGWAFDLEILLTAQKLGYKIKEFPVKIINHRESKIHLAGDSLRMLRDLIKIKKHVKKNVK